MGKIDSVACTTIYAEPPTVIDVFKCENCGHKYVEVFDLAEGCKALPSLQSQGR